ncbi:MAG: hypothetical protein Q8Q46_03295 [Candidatus Giovannonibacteria bacterium]|nr:hypothetical protein [Candidatus Giovannonibacteria bacterium]
MKAVTTIILLLASVGLVFFVAKPVWSDTASLRAEQAAVSDALARLKDLQSLRDDLLKTYNEIPRNKIERLYDLLPPKPDSGNILVMLEKLTRDRNIRLRRVEFIKEASSISQSAGAGKIVTKEAPKFNTISYSFTISAPYEGFRSLLSAMEKNLRIIDVTDISFVGGASNLFEFTLKAKSYYQK